MGTSQTGVPGDLAMFFALVVLKCDLGTVPIHRRSTMALIAKDLAIKCSYATYSLVQVQISPYRTRIQWKQLSKGVLFTKERPTRELGSK